MTGAQALLDMRRAQCWPEMVWLVDGDCAIAARDWHQWLNCKTRTLHAEIGIEASELPEVLDFRCCIGLPCHVSALRGADRGHRLHQALIDARASRVVTSIHQPSGIELLTHGVLNG